MGGSGEQNWSFEKILKAYLGETRGGTREGSKKSLLPKPALNSNVYAGRIISVQPM